MSSVNKIGDKCLTCETGIFIGTGIDYSTAHAEVLEEYLKKHNDEYPNLNEIDEMLREKYFYGKLDKNVDSFAVDKREYSESPEGIEEQNKQTLKWMRSQQNGNVGVPKCPICGSTNLNKITATRKILKVGLFGRLGTGDLGKTYQCCKCGAKF